MAETRAIIIYYYIASYRLCTQCCRVVNGVVRLRLAIIMWEVSYKVALDVT